MGDFFMCSKSTIFTEIKLKSMSTPSQSIKIAINGNQYELTLPNTGQLLDINVTKAQLGGNYYDSLKYSVDPDLREAALTIDVAASFGILAPQLKKDLNVKSLLLLKTEQMAVITEAYKTQYLPWYEEWQKFLSSPKDAENAQ